MLYPQHYDKFDKTISKYVWEKLQKEAAQRIKEDENKPFAHPNVRKHWESIVDGNVPFGYSVKGD